MAKPNRSHDALQQLLQERARYEQWMATLESRRESTPEHVYKRVHADYGQRLASVREQLAARTGEIRSTISGLKEQLTRATEQETERVDELHEAELRAVVGEYTSEQWGLRKREVEVDLKRFGDEKKKISEELNQLLLIIEQTTGQELGDEPASSSPSAQSTPPAPAAPPAPPAPPTPADATRMRSKTPSRSRAAMRNAPAPAPEEGKTPVPIESLAPAGGLPASPSEPRAATSHGKRSKSSAFAPASPDPRRENEKTLKCAECGAMNYPTEWYCENCGGELSAM